MIIQHNISAINSYRQLSGNNSALSKNLEKLSSGYKINRAGDDAAGLAISEKMRAQIRGLETASKNAQDGISAIQTAEGALTEVHSMLNRMVELSTQAANGIYGTEERDNITDEITALNDEIDRIAQFTNFNGILMLTQAAGQDGMTNADGNKLTLQVGDTASQTIDVDIGEMNATTLGVKAVDVTTVAKANESIEKIKTAISTVSEQRAAFGALQNRLEHTINNLGVTTENITAAESRIRDTDMAKEMMEYTKDNILVQSAQSMLAQANMIPQGVLQLLQ